MIFRVPSKPSHPTIPRYGNQQRSTCTSSAEGGQVCSHSWRILFLSPKSKGRSQSHLGGVTVWDSCSPSRCGIPLQGQHLIRCAGNGTFRRCFPKKLITGTTSCSRREPHRQRGDLGTQGCSCRTSCRCFRRKIRRVLGSHGSRGGTAAGSAGTGQERLKGGSVSAGAPCCGDGVCECPSQKSRGQTVAGSGFQIGLNVPSDFGQRLCHRARTDS